MLNKYTILFNLIGVLGFFSFILMWYNVVIAMMVFVADVVIANLVIRMLINEIEQSFRKFINKTAGEFMKLLGMHDFGDEDNELS